jgi:dipeptidase E
MSERRHIVALGGGSFRTDPGNPLDDFLLALTAAKRPRVLFVPTASGDAEAVIEAFRRSFLERHCVPSVLRLFQREHEDLAPLVLEQDLIFVGGGNTANQQAVWRVHGVDALLVRAWEQGTVLAGVSAGALCWFEEGVTDSFHPTALRPIHGLLGLLDGSFCPHYDSEEQRRPLYRRFVAEGTLGPGYAADDGVGLHFHGTVLAEAVSFRPGAAAWRVAPAGPSPGADTIETRIEPRLLSSRP